MLKKLADSRFHDVQAFDKVYLPLSLNDIFPELGSTLWYCIEAQSNPVETAEGWFAAKTMLRKGLVNT